MMATIKVKTLPSYDEDTRVSLSLGFMAVIVERNY